MPDAEAGKAQLVGEQSSTAASLQDTRTLVESFNLLNRYGDEYMDEAPLVGEPGSFILSRTGDADRGTVKRPASTVNAASAPTRSGTPQVRVDMPSRASEKGGTSPSSDENRSKRRKSRGAVGSF